MASHKHANNGLVARSRATQADILRMAEAVAASQQTDWVRGLGPIAVSGRAANSIEFTVLGGLGNKYKQIAFAVSTTEASGETVVRSRISFFRTSQATIMGFIPAGPKLMTNYSTYKLFLERLAATLREADPTARISISDAADTDVLLAASTSREG